MVSSADAAAEVSRMQAASKVERITAKGSGRSGSRLPPFGSAAEPHVVETRHEAGVDAAHHVGAETCEE